MSSRICIIVPLVLLLLTSSAPAQDTEETENYYNTRSAPRDNWRGKQKQWMKKISDDTSIGRITIPGTHDTGARFWGDLVQCQSWSVADQLGVGIRYLDIRCAILPGQTGEGFFGIYHGPMYQFLSFEDVMTACRDFLTENPSECLIMRVQWEFGSSPGSTAFANMFNRYKKADEKFWYTDSAIPTLGKVRGKIVLFTTEGGMGGLDRSQIDWDDNYWVPTVFARWDITLGHEWHAWSANANASNKGLWLTGMNGTSGGCYPYTMASYANYYLHYSLVKGSGWYNHPGLTGRQMLGVVYMDFPGESLVDQLIQTNFR